MKLLVGLGNPGKAYALHRHNVGFRCLNRLARRYGIPFSRKQAQALVGRGLIGGEEVLVAKPQTFMNRSGEAVALLVRQLSLPLPELLVIYDDLDLPLGELRLRPRGSAGGHRGMASVIAHLGSQDFPRLRIGIGRPPEDDEEAIIPHVLSPFLPSEQKLAAATLARAVEAVASFVTEGLEAAMNRYN